MAAKPGLLSIPPKEGGDGWIWVCYEVPGLYNFVSIVPSNELALRVCRDKRENKSSMWLVHGMYWFLCRSWSRVRLASSGSTGQVPLVDESTQDGEYTTELGTTQHVTEQISLPKMLSPAFFTGRLLPQTWELSDTWARRIPGER